MANSKENKFYTNQKKKKKIQCKTELACHSYYHDCQSQLALLQPLVDMGNFCQIVNEKINLMLEALTN